MSKRNKGPRVSYRKERECWEVIEYNSGRLKRHATGFSRREEAEDRLAELIVERNTPQKNEEEITLGEIIAYYVKEHLPTLPGIETAINCIEHLLPFWGDMKLDEIKKSASMKYLKHRQGKFIEWQKTKQFKKTRILSDETVRRELQQLQAAIGYAYKDNIIGISPHVWKPEKSPSRNRWLTKTEAAKLIRAAKKRKNACEYLPLFILLGLYTGARSEAILTLRWHQIDFKNEFIDFREGQRSKTKGRAIVPIPRRLLRELKKARSRGTDIGYVIHNDQSPIKSVKNSFKSACDYAGLEDVTPNTLRHTAASWMVQKGVPIIQVSRYLGHSSTQMVESTYGHMSPDHLQDAKESYG